MAVYETIEWTNLWIEERGNREKRRVLLVGDSIVNGARSFVREAVGDGVLVDAMTTAHALDDPSYLTELSYMLGLCEYDLIHFNNGLHGFHLTVKDYEARYRETLRFLMERFPREKLVLALSTPITVKADPGTPDPKNRVVEERNRVVKILAEEKGLALNDLYTPLLGRPELRSADGYHYLEEGYRLIGGEIARFLV